MSEPTARSAGVTVRYWAGARQAAGVAEESATPGSLASVLAEVRAGHDQAFARVLSVCSFVVGDQPVGSRPPGEVPLADGDVVEVLPPFAGGSADGPAPPRHRSVGPARPAGSTGPGRLAVGGLGVLAGLALAVAAELSGEPAVWLVAVLLQLPLLAGWHRGLGVTAATGGMVAAALIATVADVTVWLVDEVSLAPLAAVVGVGFLLGAVQQLLRRDDRSGLTSSLAATTTLSFLVTCLAAWPIVVRLPDGVAVVLAASAGLVASSLGRLAGPLPVAAALMPGFGFIAGLVAGGLLDGVTVTTGAVLGTALSLPVLLVEVMDRRDPRLVVGAWPAAAVLPYALAAPLAYAVARLLG